MDIVRKAMRGLRKLWIAREVSCRSSGNATAKWRILHDQGRFSYTTGLLLIRKELLCFLLHACIELEKCCMGRDTPTPTPTPTPGRLKRHESVGWEEVTWGHFGRPFHPTHEAWRDIAMLPEVT